MFSSAFAEKQKFYSVNSFVEIDVPYSWAAATGEVPVDWSRAGISGKHVYLHNNANTVDEPTAFMWVFVDEKRGMRMGTFRAFVI